MPSLNSQIGGLEEILASFGIDSIQDIARNQSYLSEDTTILLDGAHGGQGISANDINPTSYLSTPEVSFSIERSAPNTLTSTLYFRGCNFCNTSIYSRN